MRKKIEIPREKIIRALKARGRRLGGYARRVIEEGHVARVLSGNEFRGSAKRSPFYWETRDDVEEVLKDLVGVVARHALVPPDGGDEGPRRWCRVWVLAETGEPVKIKIV